MIKNFLYKILLIGLFIFNISIFSQETKQYSEFKLALNLYNDGMYELAMEQFKNFISMYPSSNQVPDAKYYLALCLLNLKQYEDAKVAFQNFALSFSEHAKAAEAWFKIGEINANLNKYSEAAVSFERARTFYPKNQIAAEALYMAAKYYKMSDDNVKAKKAINLILQEYNNSEFTYPARLILAEIYKTDGNIELAIIESKKIIDASEKYKPEAILLLAKIYKEVYKLDEAESLLQKILTEYKNNKIVTDANIELGLISKIKNDYSKAINLFKSLVNNKQIEPSKREFILFELGKTYFAIQDFEKTIDIFKLLINEFPNTSYLLEAIFYIAKSLEQNNNYNEALSFYGKIINANSSNLLTEKSYINASIIAEKIGNIHHSINYYLNYANFTKSNTNKQEAYIRIAKLYKKHLKDYPKAIEYFESALKYETQNPNLTKILLEIGECRELMEDYKSAIEGYEYLIKSFPSSDEAITAQERIDYIKKYKLKNYENATLKLTKLITKILDAKSIEVYNDLASIYFDDLKDYQSSAENFSKLLSQSLSSELAEQALFMKALSYHLHSKIDSSYLSQAINSYKEFIEKYPKSSKIDTAILHLSSLYFSEKKLANIEEIINKHYRSNSKNQIYVSILEILGDAYFENNDVVRAIETYRRAIKQSEEKRSERLFWKISSLYYKQNQPDSAIDYLNRQLKLFPKGNYTAKGKLLLARLYFNSKKYFDALEVFKNIIQHYYIELPDDITELYIKTMIETSNFTESIEYTTRILDKLNNSPFKVEDTLKYKFYLAYTYYKIGDYRNATKFLNDYLFNAKDSKHIPEAYLILGDIYKQQGMSELATVYFKEAGQLGNPQANKDIADLLYKQERYSEAISQYQNLFTQTQNIEEKKYYLSRIILSLLKRNEISTAQEKINDFKKQYSKDKKNLAEFEYEKALAYYRNKDYNNAKKIFQNISNNYNETGYESLAEFYLGKILEINKQTQDAIKKYQYVTTKYPKTEASYRSLLAIGNIYFNSEKYEDAIKFYQEIVESGTNAGEILSYAITNLIEAYESVKLYDAALKLTRDFITLYPKDKTIPEKKVKLGVLLTRLGYYDQAIMHYNSLLDELGNEFESEIRYNLGETYYYKGDFHQAILEFLKIPYLVTSTQEIDWSATALYMAGQSYEKLGKYEQAISMYQQIIDRKGIDIKFKTGAQKEIDRVRSIIRKEN